MSTEDLNTIMESILSIPKELIKKPSVPIEIATQEANDLHSWNQNDMPQLLDIGLTKKFINSLPVGAGALQEAESIWLNERNKKEETYSKWLEASKDAYELRDIILHSFRYAYRNSDEISQKLKIIGLGKSHADMIQDLNDLAVIGINHSEELKKINFDMVQLDEAKTQASSLGKILADSNAADKSSEAKEIRDRAYTHLKNIVDEIRAAGQNIFWRTPERLKGYRSEYRHNQNNHTRNKNIDD